MRWLKESELSLFLNRQNYDVRVSHNARWIDQKCTPDVLTIIADCVLQYTSSSPEISFSSSDIWHNEYTVSNVENIFKKPSPNENMARNEYDKYFAQPMEMLAYAGVLCKDKIGGRNLYSVAKREILEYISICERNALTFIQLYIIKVLTDSDLITLFDEFFDKQSKETYKAVKEGYTSFTIQNTKINKSLECHRIFIKVINPIAFLKNKCGTERGHMSSNKITYDMLMYNRDNFRDIYSDKPKDLTRRQHSDKQAFIPSSEHLKYMSQKAKRLVRYFNDSFRNSLSEVSDERHNSDLAIHIHHIFPESDFPDICAYCENLIALTPTQHLSYAHPQGNTSTINTQYQHICLIAKVGVIKETMEDLNLPQLYDFKRFLYVCFIGLHNDIFMRVADCDFDGAVVAINKVYS